MNAKISFDEEKLCKNCSHQRRDHKYDVSEQNNDPKCEYPKCNCNHFVEWEKYSCSKLN
jgi:hypothetical protein